VTIEDSDDRRRQAPIDAAFAAMADDAEYHAEAEALAAEFAIADWEALRLGEIER
jgi:hypothetical protein